MVQLIVGTVALGLLPGVALARQTSAGTAGRFDPPAVLWEDPGPIAERDLFWGAGSAERAPQGPFTFVDEDDGGTQPKIVVTDARGVRWQVKFGEEAKAEVAASRFVWALGFATEELYFVRTGIVRNYDREGRSAGFLSPDGHFLNARFHRYDSAIAPTDREWTLRDNPFAGSRELSGLMTLMTLIANWDIGGTRNTKVLQVTNPDGSVELRYAVTDLGASFGRMGGRLARHSKWNLADYEAEGIVEKVEGGELHLDYDGLEPGGIASRSSTRGGSRDCSRSSRRPRSAGRSRPPARRRTRSTSTRSASSRRSRSCWRPLVIDLELIEIDS